MNAVFWKALAPISVTLSILAFPSPQVMEANLEQLANMLLVTLLPLKTTLVNLVQPEKIPSPTLSILDKSGMEFVIPTLANASLPSFFKLCGKLMLLSSSQLANALLPISVNLEWVPSIASSFLQPSNVELEISSNVSGKSI